MKRFKTGYMVLMVFIMIMAAGNTSAREITENGVFFSTEEDFVTRGPSPADGNPIISDGDLLYSRGHLVYMRNYELLKEFQVKYDLGLDAVDVIDVRKHFVVFSTELHHPGGVFTAGDLLTTSGAIVPNAALLARFEIPRRLNLGLDALQVVGDMEGIIRFFDEVKRRGREYWLENPEAVIEFLKQYRIDIWFSTEGTAPMPGEPRFLDGDLLSAAAGTIVAANHQLLPLMVPAGIPKRGVDFGLDAVTCDRKGNKELLYFSTEILFQHRINFTDGDVLKIGNGVVIRNYDLIKSFEARAKFIGLDALSYTGRISPIQ